MDETLRKALKTVKRYAPCAHYSLDRSLGNGKIWAKCEDCGATLQQSSIDGARKAAEEFDAAIEAIEQHKPVVRMLTDEEAIDCECDKFDNTVKFIQRKFAEKNGLTIGEHG